MKLNNKVEILNNYAEKYFRDTGKVAIKCIIVVSKDIDEEYKSDLNGKLQVQVSHPDKPVSACCN